jgi:hypothetical protein
MEEETSSYIKIAKRAIKLLEEADEKLRELKKLMNKE